MRSKCTRNRDWNRGGGTRRIVRRTGPGRGPDAVVGKSTKYSGISRPAPTPRTWPDGRACPGRPTRLGRPVPVRWLIGAPRDGLIGGGGANARPDDGRRAMCGEMVKKEMEGFRVVPADRVPCLRQVSASPWAVLLVDLDVLGEVLESLDCATCSWCCWKTIHFDAPRRASRRSRPTAMAAVCRVTRDARLRELECE